MTQTQTRRRASALVVLVGVVGLLAAAASLFCAAFLTAFGLLFDGGWLTTLVLCELAGGVLSVWGSVRVLRRRGWRLLAVGSLLGLYPSIAAVLEGHPPSTSSDFFWATLACLPPLALVLTVLRPVRRAAVPSSGV